MPEMKKKMSQDQESLCLEISLVRKICVKIVLNVVKASRLVQIKLITERSKLGLGHFENFIPLFVYQYGIFSTFL